MESPKSGMLGTVLGRGDFFKLMPYSIWLWDEPRNNWSLCQGEDGGEKEANWRRVWLDTVIRQEVVRPEPIICSSHHLKAHQSEGLVREAATADPEKTVFVARGIETLVLFSSLSTHLRHIKRAGHEEGRGGEFLGPGHTPLLFSFLKGCRLKTAV